MNRKILIVDDEEIIRNSLSYFLSSEGFDVDIADNGKTAQKKIEEVSFDIVITDINMPEMDGIELLKNVTETRPETFFIIITAYGSLETAINALRYGAYDYILKPIEFEDVLIKLTKLFEHKELLLENKFLKSELQEKYTFDNIIGQNTNMEKVFENIKKVSKTDGNVLITGKSGTGKELIAKAIHYNSNRVGKKFVPINAGAIAENLVESELFGYKKGAFTGALHDKDGFFKVAQNGTLFLDEIGVIPLNVQAKLLRAIEQKEIIPVGDTAPIKVDIRIIAATNLDLKEAVDKEEFRLDLYYRLNVIEITLPPLAERKDDIPLLIKHFIQKYNKEMGRSIKGVDNETMKLMLNYEWKGEIRELENVIERAIIFSDNDMINPEDLPPSMVRDSHTQSIEIPTILKDAMKIYERNHITTELLKHNNNKELTAKNLGISVSSLYRKMVESNIPTK
ncbi:MAG: sigma-54-dependent Fis family transcriptional regulator [bacterium]|nr:sigma-54-dependent Fis family transcriptional regulator [bacterium]